MIELVSKIHQEPCLPGYSGYETPMLGIWSLFQVVPITHTLKGREVGSVLTVTYTDSGWIMGHPCVVIVLFLN